MRNQKIKAGIAGSAGYTGGELLRILLQHPNVEITFAHSRSNAGEPLYKVHADLLGETELCFTGELNNEIDVLFLCLGHGESKKFLETNAVGNTVKVIDLSQDFRLNEDANTGSRNFTYGLPEYNKATIQQATNIANPGCFATAIQLALLPLAKAGLMNEVHVTGITGSTGAGQKLQDTTHFSWRANNIQAYKSLSHQHLKEIKQTLQSLQPGNLSLNFIPWRGDFPKGIYVTAYTVCDMDIDAAQQLYAVYYEGHPFTHLSDEMIDMKQVVNTNKCVISLEKVEDKLVIHAAIDNLVKGASGQAVQNMNLIFGMPEDAGLRLKALSF